MFHGRNARFIGLGAIALGLVACPAPGQEIRDTLEGFGLLKYGYFEQTGPGTTSVLRYEFKGTALELLSPAQTINGVDLRWADASMVAQMAAMSKVSAEWSHWDIGYPSEAALTAMYPPANEYQYDIDVQGIGVVTESIDGPGDLWPDRIPSFDNYASIVSADPAGDITTLFSEWVPPAMANVTKSRVALFDSGGFVWHAPGDEMMTSAVIPGGTMTPGETYRLTLEYESRFLDAPSLTFFTDAFVNFTWKYTTQIEFVAVPAPGVGASVGVLALFALRHRRR